jgi:hypothetical protein
MRVAHHAAPIVAITATTAHFFALAQFVATHHLRPVEQSKRLQNRGNEMNAILTRLASAVIAVSLSGVVLSMAVV